MPAPVLSRPVPAVVLRLSVAFWLAAGATTGIFAAERPFDVSIGWRGMVRQGYWARVTVRPAERVKRVRVSVESRYGAAVPPVHYHGAEGTNSVFIRTTQGNNVVCRWTDINGKTREKTLTPKFINDNIIGVLSDSPDRFEFLGATSQNPKPIPVSPGNLPTDDRELRFLGRMVVDVPVNSLTRGQVNALTRWVLRGGRLVFTPGALVSEDGRWGILGDITVGKKATIPAPALGRLLPDFAPNMSAVPVLALSCPARNRVLWEKNNVLLAARAADNGRVVALGVFWEDMEIEDLRVLDALRRQLWDKVLWIASSDNGGGSARHPNTLVPDAAKAAKLKWYLLSFVAVYMLSFGLANWWALRVLRKFELSAVTLPAGALLLAFLAFGIGVRLRGRATHIRTASILAPAHGHVVLRTTACILKGDGGPLTVSAVSPDARLDTRPEGSDECLLGLCMGGPSGRSGSELTFTSGTSDSILSKGQRMWTVDYWYLTEAQRASGITATATLGTNLITGTIRSDLPFAVNNAIAAYGWDLTGLGTLDPGTERTFEIPLTPLADRKIRACTHCGEYHDDWNATWLGDHPEEGGDCPIAEMLEAMPWQTRNALSGSLAIVGLVRSGEPLLRVDREETTDAGTTVFAGILDVTFGATSVGAWP